MGDEFEIKDLGNLTHFLGMEVARSKEGIFVSQRKYTIDLLKETNNKYDWMQTCWYPYGIQCETRKFC